jgi:hypothetical protein
MGMVAHICNSKILERLGQEDKFTPGVRIILGNIMRSLSLKK